MQAEFLTPSDSCGTMQYMDRMRTRDLIEGASTLRYSYSISTQEIACALGISEQGVENLEAGKPVSTELLDAYLGSIESAVRSSNEAADRNADYDGNSAHAP